MSVVSDTLIVTVDGDVKVSELRVGMEILTDKKKWKPVLEIIPQETLSYVVEFRTEDGLVRLTEDHPVLAVHDVYVEDDIWTPVNEVLTGSYVVGQHGMVEVQDMDITMYEGIIYDLLVEDGNAYTTTAVVVRV